MGAFLLKLILGRDPFHSTGLAQRILFSNRGIGLLGPVVGAGILVTGLFYFGAEQSSNAKQSQRNFEEQLAQSYAIELLEFFRSFTPQQFKVYLSRNPTCPAYGGCGFTPYKFCSHINIQDRCPKLDPNPPIVCTDTLRLINRDAIADLPSPNPLDGNSMLTKANRYYQVFVADLADNTIDGVKIKTAKCDETADVSSLGDNEAYMITVGVSWVPRTQEKKDNNIRRVVLSTVIPKL